jgi:hypothetical protein
MNQPLTTPSPGVSELFPHVELAGLTLSDLFQVQPISFAAVELVADVDAIVHIALHDLLTELLCEV